MKKIDISASQHLFVEHAKTIEGILRKAVREALLKHKQAGNTIASWKDGKVHFIKAEEIVIEPEKADE